MGNRAVGWELRRASLFTCLLSGDLWISRCNSQQVSVRAPFNLFTGRRG
jgi:hypothetical protein